jgi:hypothetical protein
MVSFEICDNVVTKYTGDNSSFVIPNTYCIDGINTEISIIKESMFKCCRSIENIEIEEGIKTIEKEAFSSCGNLSKIILPSSLENIGKLAFYGCNNLTNINIPNKVQIIQERTFSYCHKLKIVKFKAASLLKQIKSSAFRYCNSLKEIALPKRLEIIEEYAFADCSKLSKVVIPSSVYKIADNAFDKSNNVVIYTIEGSYALEFAVRNNIQYVIITK